MTSKCCKQMICHCNIGIIQLQHLGRPSATKFGKTLMEPTRARNGDLLMTNCLAVNLKSGTVVCRALHATAERPSLDSPVPPRTALIALLRIAAHTLAAACAPLSNMHHTHRGNNKGTGRRN
uniref:Uncharacterized protein n=1 Tax=Arundo donax TaxID=35708 RepID=A0A0A9E5I8_ARUDO